MTPGTVEAYMEWRRVGTYVDPGTNTGVPFDNNAITFRYYPIIPMLVPIVHHLVVTRYKDVATAPCEVEEVLYEADVTRIVTETVEVAREVSILVTIKEPVETRSLNPAATTVATAGAVTEALAALLAHWLRKRREGMGALEPEEQQQVAVEPG